MLDHDISLPEGWPTAWLERTLPALRLYTTLTSYLLSFTIIALGIGGFVAIRRSTNTLAHGSDNRPAVFSRMNKKLLKVTKGHFVVAMIYMLHVVVLMMVDAVICVFAIRDDVKSGSEAWTPQLMVEIALYASWLFTIFATAFIIVPLIQMLFLTWILARVSKRNNRTNLTDFIPEARFFSTHIAQIWSMLSFFMVSWWAPATEGSSLWRLVALQACLGSAVGWMDASFALNFRSDHLAEQEIQLSTSGVREIVAVFGETVKAAHGRSRSRISLPQYQVVAGTEESTKEDKECCR
jgi:hypothetical protein